MSSEGDARTGLRRHGERGAALVEAALAIPIILLLALGAADFGFMFLDSLTVSGAAREGARVGSAIGTRSDVDDAIIGAIAEATGGLDRSQVEAIWIFKATAEGDPVDDCAVDDTAGYFTCTGPTDHTNIYTPDGDLLTGSWDPDERKATIGSDCPADPSVCPDLLGVRLVFTHQWVTGFIGLSTGPFVEDAVFRLEPGGSG